MSKDTIPAKAADLRRGDVAWHRDGDRFAGVVRLGALPGGGEVEVEFNDGEDTGPQRYRAEEEVALRQRGLNAQRVIERLCVPEGETASAWTSGPREDHVFHAGFVALGSGEEFVALLGAWENGGHIRLLPDGGQFPYSFALADDLGLAMIEYCEGDIGVRVYPDRERYVRALDLYARGPLESPERRAEHERNVARALSTGAFPGAVEFESR